MEKCKYEGIIKIMQEDIKEIKADVKSLLSFKWHLLGIGAGISFFIYILLNVFDIMGSK